MRLKEISIFNFRNISSIFLKISGKINFFIGGNGAGKTSLLEAVYFLSHGRSFRANNFKKIINLKSDSFVVSAKVVDKMNETEPCAVVGAEKFRSGEVQLRVNGKNAKGFIDLAKYLPVQLINTNSYMLLEGEPAQRRKFLDWLLFHVEQGFVFAWQNYYKILKQRNALLKQFIPRAELLQQLGVWSSPLNAQASMLDDFRRQAVSLLEAKTNDILARFDNTALPGVTLEYRRGWPGGLDFFEALSSSLDRDVATKTTCVGPHRADLVVKIDDRQARYELSRGQAKLLVFAMSLARAEILRESVGVSSIFFIDDLSSELDAAATNTILAALESMPYQSLITSISLPQASSLQSVFHVEQGAIASCSVMHSTPCVPEAGGA